MSQYAVPPDSDTSLSRTLTNTHVFVGNASNVATDVAISGDATLNNTGAVTIASHAVSNAKFRQSTALAVVGNATNGTADVADITGSTAYQLFRVNAAGTGLEFATHLDIYGHRPIVTNSNTSITLALTDADTYQRLTGSTAITITVPTNASVAFAVGTEIDFIMAGTGKITFAPAGGVTINSKGGNLSITNTEFSGATIKKVATDTWDLVGDLST